MVQFGASVELNKGSILRFKTGTHVKPQNTNLNHNTAKFTIPCQTEKQRLEVSESVSAARAIYHSRNCKGIPESVTVEITTSSVIKYFSWPLNSNPDRLNFMSVRKNWKCAFYAQRSSRSRTSQCCLERSHAQCERAVLLLLSLCGSALSSCSSPAPLLTMSRCSPVYGASRCAPVQ